MHFELHLKLFIFLSSSLNFFGITIENVLISCSIFDILLSVTQNNLENDRDPFNYIPGVGVLHRTLSFPIKVANICEHK